MALLSENRSRVIIAVAGYDMKMEVGDSLIRRDSVVLENVESLRIKGITDRDDKAPRVSVDLAYFFFGQIQNCWGMPVRNYEHASLSVLSRVDERRDERPSMNEGAMPIILACLDLAERTWD